MLRSLRPLLQTEGANHASVDILLARIVGFAGELDQELKKCAMQQVIDLIRKKARHNATRMDSRSRQGTNAGNPTKCVFTTFKSVTAIVPESQQYLFKHSGQLRQYPIQSTQLPVTPPLNLFLPMMIPPQTQLSEPRLLRNENVRNQQKRDSTKQTVGTSCNINSRETITEYNINQKRTQYVDSSNSGISATTNFSNITVTLHNRKKLIIEIEQKINISNTQENRRI
ncbi:MAG: hypothetical protein EZS28_018712 [Streblomastix strix]|uniref:Uncharacterized protein n=1 Tax=Streblomastix strix TaxID=222440 RepID=A0A5J4VTK0_9EUKA|nr:MAG: hypothetical protein EZS28_018712 [Streblomastix strix]